MTYNGLEIIILNALGLRPGRLYTDNLLTLLYIRYIHKQVLNNYEL